ncbi:hypothetical protein Acr_16g0010250 [Actinidia rufa]|uniref:Uncharacterized protein n=1 Tax=Actinidia rufa TaxID=165716 RepID=A0A7J0G0D9_9ERIC|nr:hypothetical protein Acr_16g0010250 [Actinidia rufa]
MSAHSNTIRALHHSISPSILACMPAPPPHTTESPSLGGGGGGVFRIGLGTSINERKHQNEKRGLGLGFEIYDGDEELLPRNQRDEGEGLTSARETNVQPRVREEFDQEGSGQLPRQVHPDQFYRSSLSRMLWWHDILLPRRSPEERRHLEHQQHDKEHGGH